MLLTLVAIEDRVFEGRQEVAKRDASWMGLASVGPHFVLCSGIGWYIGYKWVDPWFGTTGVFSIIFLVLGIIAGFLNLYREVVRLNKNEEIQDNDEQT